MAASCCEGDDTNLSNPNNAINASTISRSQPIGSNNGAYVNGRAISLFDWTNSSSPIIDVIKDPEPLYKLFSKYPIIPFASFDFWTGHGFLRFLINLSNLSPSQGSCINGLRDMAFSSKPRVKVLEDSNIDLETTEQVIAPALKKKFSDFLNAIQLNVDSIRDLTKYLFTDYKISGNAYAEVTITETLGVKTFSIDYLNHEVCYFLRLDPKEPKTIIKIAAINYKTLAALTDDDVVPVFPFFKDMGNGVTKSILHIKNGAYKYYGRPDSMHSIMSQYSEAQNDDYQSKQTANNFMGQILIEVEGDDPNIDSIANEPGADNFRNTSERLEQNFTNKGDKPSTIMFMERPFGSQAALVQQFNPNTNENWFIATNERSRKVIVAAHSWSERLLGDTIAKGISTGNIFLDELKLKLPILEGIQEIFESALNKVFTVFAKEMGTDGTDLIPLGIEYPLPFETILTESADLADVSNIAVPSAKPIKGAGGATD